MILLPDGFDFPSPRFDPASLGFCNPSRAGASTRPQNAIKEMAMSDTAKTDKAARIGQILDVMKDTWDLPADCNEGELFAYAETLYDRIVSGEGKDALYAYLNGVQIDNLEMPSSDAHQAIVDRALALAHDWRE